MHLCTHMHPRPRTTHASPRAWPHLARIHPDDAGQLDLCLPELEAFGPTLGVPLRQLAALLVLDGAEDAERAVRAGRQEPQALR